MAPIELCVRNRVGHGILLTKIRLGASGPLMNKLLFAAVALFTAVIFSTLGSNIGTAQTATPEVYILGSSSVNGSIGRIIEASIGRAGFRVERHGRSSSGFSRPDFFDWQAEIGRLSHLRTLRAAIVLMGGNDAQDLRLRASEVPAGGRNTIHWSDEARWTEVYRNRTREFVTGLCSAGVAKVIMVLPNEGENRRWDSRMERIRQIYIAAVRGTCGITVDGRGGPASTEDGVHLTREGAQRYWSRIEAPVIAAIRAAH